MPYPDHICQPTCDVNNLLVSFDIVSSMSGPYSGQVEMSDICSQFVCTTPNTELWKPLVVRLTSQQFDNLGLDQSCFSRDALWLNGLITGINKQVEEANKSVNFKVSSHFTRFAKKTINSPHIGEGARTVLEELVGTFGGTPSSLYDFSATSEISIQGPVSGDSLLNELHQVAQAGLSTLYVAQNGMLVTGEWKDNTDPVEFVIPQSFVISASKNTQYDILPSRIRFRGAYFTTIEQGDKPLDGGGSGGGGGGPGKPDCGSFCAENPIEDPEANFDMHSIMGTNADLRGAGVFAPDGTIQPATFLIKNPVALNLFVNDPSVSAYFGAGTILQSLCVKGPARNPAEYLPPNRGGIMGTGIFDPNVYIKAFPYLLRSGFFGRSPFGGGLGGGGGSQGSISVHEADVTDPTRLEVSLDDPEFMSEFGVVYEQLENRYVKSKEVMFLALVRRFQELKMIRDAWDVELSYVPCLSLNQKVSIDLPETAESGGCTITGVVGQIRLKYEGDGPRATMVVTILDHGGLGNVEYCSPNLLYDPSMEGTGEKWVVSTSGDYSYAFVNGGGGRLVIRDPLSADTAIGTADITFTEPYITSGVEYTFEFEAEQLEAASLDYEIRGANTATVYASGTIAITSSISETFTTDDTELEVVWSVTAPTDQEWLITDPKLTRCVMG